MIQPEDEIAKNWQERSYLYGTPEDVVKTLSMWQEVGIEAVYLQLLDLEPSKRDESIEVIRQAINLLKIKNINPSIGIVRMSFPRHDEIKEKYAERQSEMV